MAQRYRATGGAATEGGVGVGELRAPAQLNRRLRRSARADGENMGYSVIESQQQW